MQHFPGQFLRRPATAIEAIQVPLHPYERKGIASQAIAGRFQYGQRYSRRQRRIDGIAAHLQHIQACLCRQCL
jgi:hypothetical protein